MTVRRHPPSGPLQLELALGSSVPPAGRHRPADWHLDEQTRRRGRRGVAAARARLQEGPDGGGREPGGPAAGAPRGGSGGPGGAAGRAA